MCLYGHTHKLFSYTLSHALSLSLLQLIEAELKAKERVYNYFMRDAESSAANTETESQDRREQSSSSAVPPITGSFEDSLEFNPSEGVSVVAPDDKAAERRKRRFDNWSGMESVQEHSGEENEGNGTETPHIPETEDNPNRSTPQQDIATATPTDWSQRRQLSMETTPSAKLSETISKQPSLPLLLSHTSLPHGIPTPPSSLTSMQYTPTQSSLLSSLSSVDYGSRSLLSRQVM